MEVWRNLHTAWVTEEITSMYIVLHDIVPTNQCMHVIGLVESDRCQLEFEIPSNTG